MCHFINCYTGPNGYIIKCEECHHFQVAFGTTVLTLNAYDFYAFLGIVSYKKDNLDPKSDPAIRCIVLPTPCNTVHLLFNEQELNDLHFMLQEADTEIKAQQLISLFVPK